MLGEIGKDEKKSYVLDNEIETKQSNDRRIYRFG